LTPLEPEERTGNSKEDDLLDIPAFLRRQAN
jgi:cell division protein FtsZ